MLISGILKQNKRIRKAQAECAAGYAWAFKFFYIAIINVNVLWLETQVESLREQG